VLNSQFGRASRLPDWLITSHTTDFLVVSMLPGLLEIDRFLEKQDWKLIEPIVNEVIDRPGEEYNSSLYSWMSAILSSYGSPG
jgi:hypothetical protein